MIVLKSNQELKREKNNIREEIYSSVKLDIDTIEKCYDSVDDNYGPMVILINEEEWPDILKKYSILNQIEPEEELIMFKNDEVVVSRTCYLLNDSGFAVYTTKRRQENV